MAPSRLLANVTVALVALSSLLLQVALFERQAAPAPGWIQLGIAASIAVAAAFLGGGRPLVRNIAFGVLVCMPVVWDQAMRGLVGVGDPYEVQMSYTLRNLMLVLVALRSDARSQQFAGLASFFLVLFSFLWTMNLATTLLLVAYALLGMWWLLGSYWEGLQGRFAEKSEQAIPVRPTLVALGTVAFLVLAVLPLIRSTRVTTALQGFFPSSGGSQWTDEFAQAGVGDGDQMVAAEDDATSFGAVESELFLESKMPSLYDVFNEESNAVPKKRKKGRRRAIPLAPSFMQKNHKKLGQNKRTGREFDTVRTRAPKKPPAMENLESHALVQVGGRGPLHLGLYAYDTWDGRTLGSSGEGENAFLKLDLDKGTDRVWLRLSSVLPGTIFDHTDRRQLRIINLNTNRVPAPPNLTAINLDHLSDTRMFRFEGDGVLALAVDEIPQLTVLSVESLRRQRDSRPPLQVAATTAAENVDRPPVEQLARDWTAGVVRGWPQVEAIRERLREEYILDPEAMVPEDASDSAEHFLLESKRGPDYLFATSAALMLRSLGYETRVRSGLYVRPDNFNRLARLTPVFKEDAHFWIEVRSSAGVSFNADGDRMTGSWITVEPTPGYEQAYTPETLIARLSRMVLSVFQAIADRPATTTAVVAALAVAFWFRAPLLDLAITAWWSIAFPMGDARRRVIVTLRLLERRAWLRNEARPPGTTIGRWRLLDTATNPGAPAHLEEFKRCVSWALYAEGVPAAASASDIRSSCREAARVAFRSRFTGGFRRPSDSLQET